MRLSRYNTPNGFPMLIAVLAMVLGSFLTACTAVDSKGSADQTSIYLLRHAGQATQCQRKSQGSNAGRSFSGKTHYSHLCNP